MCIFLILFHLMTPKCNQRGTNIILASRGELVYCMWLWLIGQAQAYDCPWYFPHPSQMVCEGHPTPQVVADICSMSFQLAVRKPASRAQPCKAKYCEVQELISHYSKKVFQCSDYTLVGGDVSADLIGFTYQVDIELGQDSPNPNFGTRDEAYSMTKQGHAFVLSADKYEGLVRAFQTFSQSFKLDEYTHQWQLLPREVEISDMPAMSWRATMMDTSRHYLPLSSIYDTIDSLMYAKMSVLHWHMVDEDSFPVVFPSHPQIAKGAAFSPEETYSYAQLQQIVRYASVRAVRVVPELDVPSHASSWGKYWGNRDIACPFGPQTFMGSLDLSMVRTYTVLQEVIQDVLKAFPSKYIHLGADQFRSSCFQNSSYKSNPNQLKSFMERVTSIVTRLDETRVVMFWYNNIQNLIPGSAVLWWGGGLSHNAKLDGMEVVLAYYPSMYMDTGVNNYLGSNYGSYNDWMQLYSFSIPKNIIVIGAEGPLWSEINNEFSQMIKLWPRLGSIAMRTWDSNKSVNQTEVLEQLILLGKRLEARSIPSNALVNQFCQNNLSQCN